MNMFFKGESQAKNPSLKVSQLRIRAPTRYNWTFNGPRNSRHLVERRNFLPLNRISEHLQGITLFNPLPPRPVDLVHAFNRLVIDGKPYIIGFESHLPRAFTLHNTAYFRMLARDLASTRCRKIVAMSEHARDIFTRMHIGEPWWDDVAEKLTVRYPNLPVPPLPETSKSLDEPIRLLFVGGHFGRKGGCVAVRIAEEALRRKLPIEVDIVSSLDIGGAIWTDPANKAFFDRYLALLDLPNVRHHGPLSNSDAMGLMRRAHFLVLTTFADTFGFSVIEAMAAGTPALVTKQGALMEFLEDGKNAIVVDLPLNEDREWHEIRGADRSSTKFETSLADEIERMTEQSIGRLVEIMESQDNYTRLRNSAHATATQLFDAADANEYWDDLYEKASHCPK